MTREIRATGLASYNRIYRSWLSNYHSREIRAMRLTSYIRICKSWLSDQYITLDKSKPLDSLATLEYTKVSELSDYYYREIRATRLTVYIRI